MKRNIALLLVAGATGLAALTGCGSNTGTGTTTTAAGAGASAASTAAASATGSSTSSSTGGGSSATASATTGTADVKTAETSLGTILVDGKGMSVYYYDKDTPNSGKSTCSGNCLAAWPAVKASSAKPVVEGVTATVGTITRDDGSLQVTVNGLPIYLYAKDTKAGDVVGQAVGDVWWVVAPDGAKITTPKAGS
jgi:predicted lipoprotein with Yx(FWY)xxD motif